MKFTRLLFCEACEAHQRPKPGDVYLVIENEKEFFLRDSNVHRGEYGFVPHIIWASEITHNTVLYYALCAMDGCGIKIIKDEEGENQRFDEDNGPIVIGKDGNMYHYNKAKKAELYKGNYYFIYKHQQPKLLNCSTNNWRALMNTKFINL